jgi:hypothetical protein
MSATKEKSLIRLRPGVAAQFDPVESGQSLHSLLSKFFDAEKEEKYIFEKINK